MTKTKFTPVDAARVALTAQPVSLTPSQLRVVVAAATVWCRELQFPTVREIAAALGRTSPSTVLFGFRHVINVQATVIELEWRRIETGVGPATPCDRISWLGWHAQELAAVDRTCLRLPALVWAAVVSADRSALGYCPDLGGPLHVLAAMADRPALPSTGELRGLLSAAAGIDLGGHDRHDTAAHQTSTPVLRA